MDLLTIFFISVGLAMDCFAVSVGKGIGVAKAELLRYKLGWIDGQLKVDQRITAVGAGGFDLVVARGKKRQVVESKGIAQTNRCLDKNGGVGEDGQACVYNGITAAEIGEGISVRARNPVESTANGETIAPTDFRI